MDPARWNQILSLYSLALDTPETERAAKLRSMVDANPALIDEVLALLENDAHAGRFLEPLSPDSPFTAGQLLANRFLIQSRLGRGGMGTVYAAQDQHLNEPVALKVVNGTWPDARDAQRRLRREALIARKLTHHNICRVFDVIDHIADGETWTVVVMERLDGQTLAEHLRTRQRLTEPEARAVIEQVLAALAQAHADGIAHLDLKPANIMLASSTAEERVVVMDFGLARAILTDGRQPTATRSLFAGTPEYMSPEQLRGLTVDARSDFYSLGVIMYELIAGQRHTSGAHGLGEAVGRLIERPTPLREKFPATSLAYDRVTAACLEIDPNKRFPNAAAILQSLASPPRASFRIPRRALTIGTASTLAASAGYFGYQRLANTLPAVKTPVILVPPVLGSEPHAILESYLRRHIEQSATVKAWEMKGLKEVATSLRLDTHDPRRLQTVDWRKIAARGGAHFVLHALVSPLAGSFNLQCVLERIDPKSGMVLRQWDRTRRFRTDKEALEAVSEISSWSRQLAGESADAITTTDRPPELVTTASFEALRLFEAAESVRGKNRQEALSLLREATRLDPDFAMAWMRLGDWLTAEHDWYGGYQAWTRAVALADSGRLSQRESLRIRAVYAADCGDHPARESAALRWEREFPGDQMATWEVFQSRLIQNHAAAAEEVLPRLAAFGRETRPYLLGETVIGFATGDIKRIESAAKRFQQSPQAYPVSARLECIAAALRQDWERALKLAQTGADHGDSPSRSAFFALLATIQFCRGHVKEATLSLADGIRFDSENALPQQRAIKYAGCAYIAWLLGDQAKIKSNLELLLAKDPSPVQIPFAASLLYRIGLEQLADQLLKRWTPPPTHRFARCRLWMSGERALARGEIVSGLEKIAAYAKLQYFNEPPEPITYAMMVAGLSKRLRDDSITQQLTQVRIWYTPEYYPVGMIPYLLKPEQFHQKG